MSDETTGTGDSEQLKREKREQEERSIGEGATEEKPGDPTTEEGLLEGMPAARANRPTG